MRIRIIPWRNSLWKLFEKDFTPVVKKWVGDPNDKKEDVPTVLHT